MANQPTPPEPKKSLGQHWLDDQASLLAMCQGANIQPTDVVLEIGPGLGSLTKLLVERAKRVVAVELDKNLATRLPKQVKSQNLEVVQADILNFDFTTLPPEYKVVANIPYYVTSNLLRTLSETPNPPTSATLLTQKEVARRVAAEPGALSLLAVAVQFYWQASLGEVIPAELFMPPPKVDSQILVLARRDTVLFPDVDEKAFFRIVKAGFAQRRKTLLNSLSNGLHLSRMEITAICKSVDIDPTRRAQTLALDDWHNLYNAFHP